LNNFEFALIGNIVSLENVLWWHRVIDRRGFRLNGFINHYPDFIVKTKSGNLILVEAKGEQLKNDESKARSRQEVGLYVRRELQVLYGL
jgi:type III restriction enzyme